MKQLGLLSLLILLVFSACRKDTDLVTVTEEIPTPPIENAYQPLVVIVNGDLIGQVVDEFNQPVQDAVVAMNDNTTTTDQFGHFLFNDVDMNSKGQYITMEKDGYFLGSRRFFPQADVQSRVKVQMLEKNFNQSFNTNGPEAIVFGSVTIDFPAGGIVHDTDGTTYDGNVLVAAKFINPLAQSVYDQMPGNLQGVNTENDEVALKTLGMIAVELQGENGQKLNIAEGQTARLTYILSDLLLANAPETIPMWSFNEEIGMWVQESEAVLANGQYIAELSHFSFWNCDIPSEYVYLSMTIQDQNGIPVQNAGVSVTSGVFGTSHGYTDDEGYVSGIVPAGENLTIECWSSYYCPTSFYSDEIGPFSEDVYLEEIMVDSDEANATLVTGRLINCDGDALINGVIIINFGEATSYFYTNEGNFEFYLDNCVDFGTIEFVGYDLDNFWSTSTFFLETGSVNELFDVEVCESSTTSEVITFEYNGVPYSYLGVAVNSPDVFFIEALASAQDSIEITFTISGSVDTPGNYTELGFVQSFMDTSLNPAWNLSTITPNGNAFQNIEITEIGNNVVGTFSTFLLDLSTDENVLIEGTFNVPLQ